MTSSTQLIKQIACGRRKPDMTRKEYFDHRYRIHGSIADRPDDRESKPHKYLQTQVFDSAFGPRPNGPPNPNHPWFGRDDVTELYFRNWDHIKACFGSEYTRTTVGPDAFLFADFETAISLMAYEKEVSVKTRLQSLLSHELPDESSPTTAVLFIATADNAKEGKGLELLLSPLLIKAIEQDGQDDVYGVIANVGVVSEHFDLEAYFGGGSMPNYALVYKIFLKDSASVTALRKVQRAFARAGEKSMDKHNSFIVFGKQVLVMDVAEGCPFDARRQPQFHDLPGPSHLDQE